MRLGQKLDDVREDLVTVLACKSEGELCGQQPIMEADVVASPLKLVGKVALTPGHFRESTGKIRKPVRKLVAEDPHDVGSEHVKPEKAEVIPSTETRDNKFLLGLGGSRLL